MNTPIFNGSKVDEGPQDFSDEVYKILCAMGLSSNENDEFASYQLRDVAPTWNVKWIDNWPLECGAMTWEIFKRAFLNRFFLREIIEAKVVKFINLCQGGMSVHDYSFKFIQLSKYAPSLVFYPRDDMSRFVMCILDDLQKECHLMMFDDNMNICHLIMHPKRIEEARAKKKDRDSKKTRCFEGRATKYRLVIQDKPKFRKRFSNHVPSKFPKAREERGPRPKV